jgi:hypothetical protein
MEKEFVTYELALRMKALGFNGPCFGYFTKYEEFFYFDVDDLGSSYTKNMDNLVVSSVDELKCSAPLFSQAFRWFREKYDLYPSINIYNDKWLCVIKSTVSSETEISGYIVATINNGHPTFETYEEAELKCLEKLIEIVESKTEK